MIIRKIADIGRTYRHVQRYREILSVLFKYGFDDLIDGLRVGGHLDIGWHLISRERREQIASLSRAERVRMAIEELGPSFVKMGQIVSTRPDFLPVEILTELARLQDNVTPVPFSELRPIIEEELKAPLGEIFEEIDEEPLASASLGQVHRAVLPGGQQVVTKVQRPNIRKRIEVDLEILLHLATLLETHVEGWETQHPARIVEEFGRTLDRELDYVVEGSHLERFAAQFVEEPTVYVPRLYRELTTSRVLTMEYVEGVKPTRIDLLEEAGLDRREVARRGADLIMKQVFVHGFFHADPHPGNVLVLPDNVICYLDYGMMGRLGRSSRETFAELILAIAGHDAARSARTLQDLTLWEDPPDQRALEADLDEFVGLHFYRPLKELQLGKLLHQLLQLADRHRLQVSPDLFLMLKALSTAEGVGRVLDSDFDFIKQAKPFVRRMEIERYDPRRIASSAWSSGSEFAHLLGALPGEARELLRQLRKGRVRIEFEHRGLEPLVAAQERVSNRMAFAIVLAALIIGSSLIVLAGLPPQWHEIPVVGLTGYVISALMGFWLLLAIWRHGKM